MIGLAEFYRTRMAQRPYYLRQERVLSNFSRSVPSIPWVLRLFAAFTILGLTTVTATCQLAGEMQSGALSSETLNAPQPVNTAAAGDGTALEDARAQATRKDFPHAERTIRAYVAKYPDSAQGHFLLGYILNAEHEPKRSLAEYTTGARFHPPGAGDLLVVAADYIYLHDYADADKWLTVATQWKPGDALAWYLLGRTKYNENRFQEAISAFGKCLQLDPRNVRAENNLGLSYEGLADDKGAQRAYLTAIQWQADVAHPDPQPYLNLGMLLARDAQDGQAIPYLQKAVDLAPENPKAREQLGRAYEKMHVLGKAQSELQKAVLLAPGVSALHFQLGRIYHEEKNDEQARKQFATCAALNGSKSTDKDETPNPDSPH